jgi:hypothetical protein
MPHQETLEADPRYAFLDRQLSLLGDRDPLEVLAETPDALARLLEGHPEDRLARRPEANAWSPREILGHLIDSEWILCYRARAIRCDDHPTLTPADQERWVERQRWNERPGGEILTLFRRIRQVDLDFWRGLDDSELDRTGHHPGAGIDISLRLLRRIQAGHDLSHRDQLERFLERLSR